MTSSTSLVVGESAFEHFRRLLQAVQPAVAIIRQQLVTESRQSIGVRGVVAISHVRRHRLRISLPASMSRAAGTSEEPSNFLCAGHGHVDATVIIDKTNVGVAHEFLNGAVDDREWRLGTLA